MSPMIAVLTLFAAFMAAEADARTEPAEITIHIRGEHKAVISALLAAVDEGTTRTGIAELDSLAATYGLIGIERKGRMSPFYGYQFQLTFPPDSDGTAIAGAYWNLAYIQSVEPEPPPEAWETSSQRSAGQETTNMTRRIISKLIMGDPSRSVVAARDSTQVDSGYAKASDQDSGQGKRIAGQLIVGTFMVVVVFYMFSGFFLGVPGM